MMEEIMQDKQQLKYFMKGGYTPLTYIRNNRIDYFIGRTFKLRFKQPDMLLDRLALHVESYYPINKPLKFKARHCELVDARRMFIFFATLYLRLSSKTIAKYLNCERSTLSHHLYKCVENIHIYEYDRHIAHSIDKFMETIQDEVE